MKAVVQRRYGPPDVLRVEEIDRPVPAHGQVLLRMRAASVNPADWHAIGGRPFLVRLVGYGLGTPTQRRWTHQRARSDRPGGGGVPIRAPATRCLRRETA